MKRFIIIFSLLALVSVPAFSQVDFQDFEDAFSGFSGEVAQSLPYASTIGLTWSDATVRGFPHFGAGISAGAVTIPQKAFNDVATQLGDGFPSDMDFSDWGLPFPGYTIEGRVGLPILPFDVGAKFGTITPTMAKSIEKSTDVATNYTMGGFEVRMPIIKQKLLIPSISLAAGYTFLTGGVSTSIDGLPTEFSADTGNDTLNTELQKLSFENPKLRFEWETSVIDFKVQASENLLIFTPYAGMGYSYGISSAGGGLETQLLYNDEEITQEQIDDIKGAFEAADKEAPELDKEKGITVKEPTKGGTMRAFGGLSVNLLILKLDLTAQYSFLTKSFGATLGARIQI